MAKGKRRDSILGPKYSTLKMRVLYRKRKQRAVSYKGGHCEVCGYDKCLAALEFHHRDPTQKDFSVSGPARSWEAIVAELDKCSLLCSNCHREEHERLVDERHSELERQVRQEIPQRTSDGFKTIKVCRRCSEPFQVCPSQSQREFCSKSCAKSIDWPSVKELKGILVEKTPTQLAALLKVTPKAVRAHLRKQNIPWDHHIRINPQ